MDQLFHRLHQELFKDYDCNKCGFDIEMGRVLFGERESQENRGLINNLNLYLVANVKHFFTWVVALFELGPEDDQSSIKVVPAHI